MVSRALFASQEPETMAAKGGITHMLSPSPSSENGCVQKSAFSTDR